VRDGHDRDLEHDRGRSDRRETFSAEGEPTSGAGAAAEHAFFADDLMWWIEAASERRKRKAPPYGTLLKFADHPIVSRGPLSEVESGHLRSQPAGSRVARQIDSILNDFHMART
jgi:hypothetical protein